MQSESKSLTEKQRLWCDHIEKFNQSGLSRKEYCDRHGLNLQHMSFYGSHLKKRGLVRAEIGGFIKVTPDEGFKDVMTMRLSNGTAIEFPVSCLQKVLRSLRESN